MTIEIRPETEQLVREEIARGHARNIDELILRGVQALRERAGAEQPHATMRTTKPNLAQFLRESPLPGSGVRIERQKDSSRPADL
jgi:hypothetical protein